MGIFDRLVVCMPTVACRMTVRGETLRQWRDLGVEPIVQLQPEWMPLGHHSQRITADMALSRAVERAGATGASHVIFSEDDIRISSQLPRRLPELMALGETVTLYCTGKSHYPAAIRRAITAGGSIPEGVVPVLGRGRWCGSLAVLLPLEVAIGVRGHESDLVGWDMHLQSYLIEYALPLRAAVPNLVDHRGSPSCSSPGYHGKGARSACYAP